MKKLLLFLSLFLTTSFLFANEPVTETPMLTVSVDSVSYQRLSNHEDVCCFYQVRLSNQTNGKTIIYHSQTGVVLGTIYGTVSAEYLMWLKENVLTDESVEDIVIKSLNSNGTETNKPGL